MFFDPDPSHRAGVNRYLTSDASNRTRARATSRAKTSLLMAKPSLPFAPCRRMGQRAANAKANLPQTSHRFNPRRKEGGLGGTPSTGIRMSAAKQRDNKPDPKTGQCARRGKRSGPLHLHGHVFAVECETRHGQGVARRSYHPATHTPLERARMALDSHEGEILTLGTNRRKKAQERAIEEK